MNKLRQMSVFAHIVEAGSITQAANVLELSKSVISQHLKALEAELGLVLLKRTTRQQTLTSAGQDFYQHCKALNQLADQAWAQAQQGLSQPKGRIKITAANALMGSLVAPVISQLMQEFAEFEPELISNDQAQNLFKENIDLAIRVGPSGDSNLKQQALGTFRDVLCTSKQHLSESFSKLGYISNAWQGRSIEHQLTHVTSGETMQYRRQAQCQTNSLHTCLALILSGTGIACIPEFVFQQHQDQLQLVFPEHQLANNTIYALHPYSQFVPSNVVESIKAIKRHLA